MSERGAPPAGTAVATPRARVPLPADLRLEVVRGPDRGASAPLPPPGGTLVVGTDPGCGLVLRDPLVSRRHLELTVGADDLQARDLGSRNGSTFEGERFESLRLDPGASVRVGDTELQVRAGATGDDAGEGPIFFGEFLGGPAMREMLQRLERAAASDAVVLLHGETGTGKELLAEAIHRKSRRSGAAYVVCDLAGVSASLIESELYGHMRGAFTGADRDRDGAFAAASGGTIFLDEIGELGLDLQPRLLRVLERRQVKPVGANTYRDVDVRVIVATNRDLEAEVQAGRFRRDLYHRVSVVDLHVPPLRQRAQDIPVLVAHLIARLATAAGRPAPAVAPEAMAALAAHDWPGNIRELRNVLERALAIAGDTDRLGARLFGVGPAAAADTADHDVPFKQAKERLVEVWEREYLRDLLTRAGGNITAAARLAGLARPYLHDLLAKHGLSP